MSDKLERDDVICIKRRSKPRLVFLAPIQYSYCLSRLLALIVGRKTKASPTFFDKARVMQCITNIHEGEQCVKIASHVFHALALLKSNLKAQDVVELGR